MKHTAQLTVTETSAGEIMDIRVEVIDPESSRSVASLDIGEEDGRLFVRVRSARGPVTVHPEVSNSVRVEIWTEAD